MLDFRSGKTHVIVATDILARGIDIGEASDGDPASMCRARRRDYVHRMGRTARANREGEAVTFVSPDEMFRLRKIEKTSQREIPGEEVPAEFGEAPDPAAEIRTKGAGA